MIIKLITREKVMTGDVMIKLWKRYSRLAKPTDIKPIGVAVEGGEKNDLIGIYLFNNGVWQIS